MRLTERLTDSRHDGDRRLAAVVAVVCGLLGLLVIGVDKVQRGELDLPGSALLGRMFVPSYASDLLRTESAVQQLDDFFGLSRVHDVQLDVDQIGYESLLARPSAYVHASLRLDGIVYDNVGLRLKGDAGSFVPLDGAYPEVSGDGNGAPGKSAFIVDFNRYIPGLNHLGLEKLTLNNLAQDPSGLHEFLGYALFRAVGVPASRVAYGSVSLNGQSKGLYVLVEATDNDAFLARWFGSSTGNLYEGQYGVDLRAETIGDYDQDNGMDRSKRDLARLVEDLDALGPTDDMMAVVGRHVDLDEYLAFAATELYLGHWDGYAMSGNNYVLYHNPADDRWSFLPWGIDQVFVDPLGEHVGVMKSLGPSWKPGGGRLHKLCFGSPACRQRLQEAFTAVLDQVEAMDLMGLRDQAQRLIEPLLLAEASRYGDPDLTRQSMREVGDYITARRGAIAEWLPCLVDGVVDHDGDGFNGCTEDCDDYDPTVHPGATELCNLRDDDCSGGTDEPAACSECLAELGADGREYVMCMLPLSWSQARRYCQERGLQLAVIRDTDTLSRLTALLVERTGSGVSWAGLRGRALEAEGPGSDAQQLRAPEGLLLDAQRTAGPAGAARPPATAAGPASTAARPTSAGAGLEASAAAPDSTAAGPASAGACVVATASGLLAADCAARHAFFCGPGD